MPQEPRSHLRFRIEPHLQKQLEKARKESGRTLTAEINERLKKSFSDEVGDSLKDLRAEWRKGLEDLRTEWDVHFKILQRALPDASDVASEIGTELDGVSQSLSEIQSQVGTILSHLGLPDHVAEAKALKAKARMERAGRSEAEIQRVVESLEKRGFKIARISKQADKDDNGEKQ